MKNNKEFENFLDKLAIHESIKNEDFLDSRGKILVNAGIQLNWLGDFLSNPKIKYKKAVLPVYKILFTGTNPEWNVVLLERCKRLVKDFQVLIKEDEKLREKFISESSFGKEPILVRKTDKDDVYQVLDGMHRFVGAVINGKESVDVYVPINEDEHLPVCEPHVIYDLIRGFQRNAKENEGKKELYYALKLLSRTYENVNELLNKRFSFEYMADRNVQDVIDRILKEHN